MDLTTIEPFRLANFEITPARGEIEHAGVVSRVEPKVMSVLVALARRRGQTVSREALIDEVWEGRAVTDDAVTRCISALRRILRDGYGVEIRALPKLGYVLTVESGYSAAAPPLALPPPNRMVIAAGLVLAAALTVALAFGLLPASPANEARIRPLTAMPGMEVHPALAPAGGHVAFVHKDATGHWDLYFKSVAGGEPQRLTNDSARERRPVWSSGGDELVYARLDGDVCEVFRMTVPGGTPRKIAPCGASIVHSLDWSPDGRLLALTIADARLEPGRLSLIALAGTAQLARLQTTLAADDARFSPDGKTLALTLSPAIGAEDLYLLDLGSSDLRRVTSDNAKIHGLDWSPDGRSLVYASNRGGSFGLHRLPRDGGEPVSLMPSLQDLENPSLAGRRIAYEAWSETGELKTLRIRTGSSKSALTFPTDSTRLEWHPDVASDGAVAFVSDRGGAPEIWLSHDGKTRQLTHFGNAYIHTPKFSPDGKRIAFSAPQAGHFNLYLVDRNGTLSRLTNVSANDMSPAWSRDGRTLYFASDREAGWRPWKVDTADGAAVQISRTPARAVYVEGESELLVVDPVKGGLHRIELERPDAPATRLIAGIVPSDWANVALKGTSIFYISREPPDRAVLRRFDRASGRDTALATLDDFYFRSGLAVANDDTLVYAVTRTDDVSLMLLEYQTLVAY